MGTYFDLRYAFLVIFNTNIVFGLLQIVPQVLETLKPLCMQSSPPRWWRGEPDNQQLPQASLPEYFLPLSKIDFFRPPGTGASGR